MYLSYQTRQRTLKVLFVLVLLTGLVLQCDIAQAQAHSNVDSIGAIENEKLARPKNPVYIGYEIATGVPALNFKSDISKLQTLHVPFAGGKIGGIISNSRGKLKGYAGLYYSDCSVPVDFDLLEGGMSANIYVLRLKEIKYHTVEPYLIADLSYSVIKYYGNYLPHQDEADVIRTDNAFLGKTSSTQARIGGGFEYQLESIRNKFIHLFVEGGAGMSLSTTASNHSFANTKPVNQMWVSAGVNFGIIK